MSLPNTEDKASPLCSSLIHPIQGRLCFAMCTARQARKMVLVSWKTTKLISGIRHESKTCLHTGFRPSSLSEIFRFSQGLRTKMIDCIGNTTILICAGQHPEAITNTALALGGFLIMYQQYSADQVLKIFTPILQQCVGYLEQSPSRGTIEDLSLRDCWMALHNARSNFANCPFMISWLFYSVISLSPPSLLTA
jgi:hypothetical protein